MTGTIVFARQRIGASFGGAEGYVALLARAVRARGANVRLMAQTLDAEVESDLFSTVRVQSRRINLWGVCTFARAVRLYKREHPDETIISFDRTGGADFIRAGDGSHRAYLAAMGQSARARLSIKHQVLLTLERRAYTSARLKYIFANSNMVAREIHDLYGVPEEKLGILYTGLPAGAATPAVTRAAARQMLGLETTARVLLFAGHNYERKGLDTLLRGLSLERERNWTLLVAGRGNAARYRRAAESLAVSKAVRFLGPCALETPFAASDLFVLPTRYDPLARVCLEAARTGLPVLTTRRNGFAEWIDDRGGYVTADPDDPGELAAMLRRAWQDDLQSMGAHLRDRVAILTIEKNAEDLMRKIEEFGQE